MLRALGEMRIEGVSTTLALQRAILKSARFGSGDVNTGLVSELMAVAT